MELLTECRCYRRGGEGEPFSANGSLTVIVKEEPMFVTFPASPCEFLRARKELRSTAMRHVRSAVCPGRLHQSGFRAQSHDRLLAGVGP